jgi:hypothetical protein
LPHREPVHFLHQLPHPRAVDRMIALGIIAAFVAGMVTAFIIIPDDRDPYA